MTRVSELGKNYENLPSIMGVYEEQLADATKNLDMKGKLLEACNSENSAWLHYYDQRAIELHSLVKFFKQEEDRIRSVLYRSYKENFNITLSMSEINKYIDSETDYLYIHSLLIEVEELYELYKAVVSAYTTRNYTLSNITKLRVASLEHTEI